MDDDFKNNFYEKLKDEGINDEFIKSLDELIKYDNFSSETVTDLINGEFDE